MRGGKSRPKFHPGDLVRTKVGIRDNRIVRTEVVAQVRCLMWHGERSEWVYFLEGNSRRRHRWYLAEDLEVACITGDTSQV
ncbi:MAG: hypothetical protein JWN70_924 [Planctomycetaceae bacterium]|nr:hypothetical protein [Planctomycetaceae bacterium]